MEKEPEIVEDVKVTETVTRRTANPQPAPQGDPEKSDMKDHPESIDHDDRNE